MPEKKKEVSVKGEWNDFIEKALTIQEDALPKNFNKSRFAQNTVAFLMGSDDKVKAFMSTPQGMAQIKAGLLKGAFLGLDFLNKECYLIPYGKELQFQMDYKGAKKVAKRYSTRPILDIFAEVVREGDEFSYDIIDGEQTVNHKPQVFNKGKVIGAYAVCKYTDGGKLVEVMNLDELESARNKSKSKSCGAWQFFTNEMYKKVVLRRLCKHVDISFENADQYNVYQEDMAIQTDPDEVHNANLENANNEEFKEI